MRLALVIVLISSCCAQSIPGLGTDPRKKGPLPPLVSGQTDPPQPERPQDAHAKAISELNELIASATALREQLEKDGPNVVRADAVARLRTMKSSVKSVESALKSK